MLEGLRSEPKRLLSKYFYDAAGSRIFQEIMNCGEYYPFSCELEIFSETAAGLAGSIMAPGGAFDLIELGAGDCTKSSCLLRYLVEIDADFTYMPIDISSDIIGYLDRQLPVDIPGLRVTGLHGDYFDMLEEAAGLSANRKVVLFLGSNLGNMTPADAERFCRDLRGYLNPGDLVLIGLDLKKCPQTILAAYNDKKGITRRFNLNLLERMNRELNADFDLALFEHFPTYDPETGACKSFLVSLAEQKVSLDTGRGSGLDRGLDSALDTALGSGLNKGSGSGRETIHFAKGEAIFMEISQKYTVEQVGRLGKQASFKTVDNFFDSRDWFVDTIWVAV
jgi:dimethylhistidine N-methyltransferase